MKISKEYINIPKNYEPKYKCKIKFIQWILIKLFGYKIIYENKLCGKVEIEPNDLCNNINNYVIKDIVSAKLIDMNGNVVCSFENNN